MPPFLIPPHAPNERSRVLGKLNELAYDTNRGFSGVYPPTLEYPTTGDTSFFSNKNIFAALAQKSVSGALSGLSAVDGATIITGDLICVAQGIVATDGLYTAQAGNWTLITLATDLPLGAQINVYKGDCAPLSFQVCYSGSGNILVPISFIQRFSIVSIVQDNLTCHPYDMNNGIISTVTFNVFKPRLCQGSLLAWNGITYVYSGADFQTRVATKGAATETQIVVPKYVVGDQIYGARVVNGNQNVSSRQYQYYVDINNDGRCFAKQ